MTDPASLLTFFKGMFLFAGAAESALLTLAGACRLTQAPRGLVIFSRGDPAEAFYVVRSGLVAEFIGGAGGDSEALIKERRAGDFFGEMGIILNEPELVTVMAIQDSTLVVIHREVFRRMLETELSITRRLLQIFARRVKASGEQQATQTLMQAPARLAYILLRLEQEEGGRGTVSVTQEYLAQRCGLARQTAARILGGWRRKGWVSTQRGLLTIHNRAAVSQELEIITQGKK